MAVNRQEFWQKVTEIDSDEKLRGVCLRQLGDYRTYFVEVQYDPTLPEWEKTAASNHLDRLKDEIARRRYLVGIGVTLLGIVVAIVFGMMRSCVK